MDIKDFEQRLKSYTFEVAKANNEATKAYVFLEFIHDVFREVQVDNPHKLYPALEKSIKSEKTLLIKGRVDAILGNLIIEFESNLKERKIEESTGQLKRYTAILWNNEGIVEYLCVATDGLNFLIYRPRSAKTEDFTESDIELETVDKFDIREEEPNTIYKRLDRYMLYQTLRAPTADDIVGNFGSKSIILKDCMALLKKAWQEIKPEISAVYNEWAKYLSIVYGSEVQNEELFLKHTYLATLAKLMVYSYYQQNTLPTSKEVIHQILTGVVFREYGIENFLVEDFFSWIVKEKVSKEGMQIVYRILDGLATYDLTGLNEDVFKELYQQLVDPAERHDLGEYYTPDWLAEMIVREVVKDARVRVLDPACGSGTFLASTIRHKLSIMPKMKPSEKVKTIIQTVCGIDVHPLAVLISKANYLMALGKLLSKKEGSVVIPVYMADSIVFPTPTYSVATFGKTGSEAVYLYKVDKEKNLVLPKTLVDSNIADDIVDSMRDFALRVSTEPSLSSKGFQTYVEKKFKITKDQFDVIIDTTNTLIDLIKNNKDTIHAFILKNVYKPSTIGRFEIIVGNPPWLSYRYVKSVERQQVLKEMILRKYRLLNPKDEKLLTHMELATLFLLRCVDLYLKDKGTIGFVMPRAVFTSDQHHNLRNYSFTNSSLSIMEVWDLDRFFPLFNVPSCVMIGAKAGKPSHSINAIVIGGKIKHKNLRLKDFNDAVAQKQVIVKKSKINLTHVGKRSAWTYGELEICGGKPIKRKISPYLNKFRQGATIVPRPFWFVEAKSHERLGIKLDAPYVETTQRASDMAKKDYLGIQLSGNVESDYLYSTLLGSDILPFCHLPFRLVVLPILAHIHSYKIMNKELVTAKAHEKMVAWLSQAEKLWNTKRGEKAEKMNIYERLDRGKGITNQDASAKFEILYNTSGTFLNGCVVDLSKKLEMHVDGTKLKINGFVVDAKAYYCQTEGEDEAYYLSAVFNSTILDTLIKPFQSRGLWGERDIHKKPLEQPIDEFDPKNNVHRKLAKIGKESTQKARSDLPKLLTEMKIEPTSITPNAVGRLRSKIRDRLETEISEIDGLVCEIMTA